MWTFYVQNQQEILDPEQYEMRLEDGFYPKEMPKWFREMNSHEDMWKYGIWPQHSLLQEGVAKHQKKFIPFKGPDYYNEPSPI